MVLTRVLMGFLAFLGGAAFGFWGVPTLSHPKTPEQDIARADSVVTKGVPESRPVPAAAPTPSIGNVAQAPAAASRQQTSTPDAKAAASPEHPPEVSLMPGRGTVRPNFTAPEVVRKVEPQYTDAARRANVQGSVILTLFVTPDGRPQTISVIRGLAYGLNRKAIDAVSHWHFRPGMQNGRPVMTKIQLTVQFR